MGDTVNRNYPYPGVSTVPDVPYDVQQLADAVDADVQGIVDDTATSFGALPLVQGGVVSITVTSGTSSGATVVTFPTGFPAPPAVVLTYGATAGPASSSRKLQPRVDGRTATGFTANLETADGTNVGATFTIACSWVAVEL